MAPGIVLTDEMATWINGDRTRKQSDCVPLGRPGDVEPQCVHLASDEAGWVAGTVIQLTAGSRVPIGYMAYLHKVNKRRQAAD